jgi:hypothetical protein
MSQLFTKTSITYTGLGENSGDSPGALILPHKRLIYLRADFLWAVTAL